MGASRSPRLAEGGKEARQPRVRPPSAIRLHEAVTLFEGDCLVALKQLPENSIDSCCTDPPYHLQSIVKRFAKTGRTDKTRTTCGPFQRHATGFMNKQWDGGDVAFRPEVWREVLHVLKPGAFLLAFGGTRTYHRMACAIEDAGFVVYDCITWLYGQGFPKSKKLPDGFGTALKPSCELIVLARKPLSENTIGANFEKWGTGGLNIEGCRVPCTETAADRVEEASMNKRYADKGSTSFSALPGKRRGRPLRVIDPKLEANGSVYAGRQKPGSGFDGGSKAMGTTDLGRWPANVITDGSEEVFSAFPNAPGQLFATGSKYRPKQGTAVYGDYGERPDRDPIGDSGSAARFFYSAKADADDRLGFTHPTIKPLDLIRYLVRLITPPGGTCLDPFAGTGTLGEAAYQEGMKAILIEREAEYQAMIRERIRIMQEGGYARDVAKMRPPKDPGLLFGE